MGCCCYHKGTYFQANHNVKLIGVIPLIVVVATTKVHIFKQITTIIGKLFESVGCCCYHKGTYFQANHNVYDNANVAYDVVVATTKVHIFKQITTAQELLNKQNRCCCYHKGTYFQANHNVVRVIHSADSLLLLPQRYIFSSKSQLQDTPLINKSGCCCYHKGTYFQANHNYD